MPALDQGTAVNTLGALAGLNSFTATTTPTKIRLMMNAPTATVAGTEISGSGYTAGGITISWGTVAGTATGALVLNSNALSWTNGGVSAWTIVGLEIWDSSGTPVRKAWGIWDDQPLTIGPGSPFSVAIGAVGWSFP